MRRRTVLGLLIVGGALLSAIPGYPRPPQGAQKPDPSALEVQKVRDNLYVVKGGGGTTTIFVTSAGVVVVDTKNPGWGKALLEKIKTLTDKPVITLINTHSHPDHTGGNIDFPPGVEIIVQENTKKNMEIMDIFKTGKGMPTKTFKDKMSLFSGNDKIDLYYFGVGGTDGDAWVVFPALGTMAAGDGCSGRHLSIIPNVSSGGNFVGYPDTFSRMLSSVKNVDTVIPGHDDVLSWNDLKVCADFYKEFLTWTEAEKKAGKSVDEAVADYQIPDKYKAQGYTPGVARAVRMNIQGIYDELKN
jgi:cyclase